MAAKRKSALRSINPSGTPTPLDDLETQLAALLAAVLDDGRKQMLDRLSQALSDRGRRVSATSVRT
jgi:ABC-type transporter Mla subunit MlaD